MKNIHYYKCFNPRTREGCDVCYRTGKLIITSFNPRTREGCDVTAEYTAV